MIQEFELWWLISYPVVFGLGWFAARIDLRHLLTQSKSVSGNYFLGLKFLLSNQTEKAVEAFHEIIKTDGEDNVELYFALGALFRRRGEYDRAIRLHQALIDRQDLSEADRLDGEFELAMDFYKAGMLDRAEARFIRLLETPKRQKVALLLLEIYQTEKSWQRAIEISSALSMDSTENQTIDVSHFHCELSQRALTQSHFQEASLQAEKALLINRRSIRANLLLGDIAAKQGQHEQAICFWQAIEGQNPDYLAMAATRLIEAYRHLGRLEAVYGLLKAYLEQYPSIDLLTILFELSKEIKTPEESFDLVKKSLRTMPSLLGLDKLIEAELLKSDAQNRRTDLELARDLVYNQTRDLLKYRCRHCQFMAKQFYWRCPGCGKWETYLPKRVEETARLG